MTDVHALLDRARTITLEFLDAVEVDLDGRTAFAVREKTFVAASAADDGAIALHMQAAAGELDSLVAEGHPFFVPDDAPRGWIGVHLDDSTDWDEIHELVGDSYRAIAPKSVVRKHDGLA